MNYERARPLKGIALNGIKLDKNVVRQVHGEGIPPRRGVSLQWRTKIHLMSVPVNIVGVKNQKKTNTRGTVLRHKDIFCDISFTTLTFTGQGQE